MGATIPTAFFQIQAGAPFLFSAKNTVRGSPPRPVSTMLSFEVPASEVVSAVQVPDSYLFVSDAVTCCYHGKSYVTPLPGLPCAKCTGFLNRPAAEKSSEGK